MTRVGGGGAKSGKGGTPRIWAFGAKIHSSAPRMARVMSVTFIIAPRGCARDQSYQEPAIAGEAESEPLILTPHPEEHAAGRVIRCGLTASPARRSRSGFGRPSFV